MTVQRISIFTTENAELERDLVKVAESTNHDIVLRFLDGGRFQISVEEPLAQRWIKTSNPGDELREWNISEWPPPLPKCESIRCILFLKEKRIADLVQHDVKIIFNEPFPYKELDGKLRILPHDDMGGSAAREAKPCDVCRWYHDEPLTWFSTHADGRNPFILPAGTPAQRIIKAIHEAMENGKKYLNDKDAARIEAYGGEIYDAFRRRHDDAYGQLIGRFAPLCLIIKPPESLPSKKESQKRPENVRKNPRPRRN